MIEEAFSTFGAADKKFIEQFQTTSFDARIFELYLHAYFVRSGFTVAGVKERPDYLVTRNGLTVAVEAATANKTQVPEQGNRGDWDRSERPRGKREATSGAVEPRDHDPLGSALYSKLQKQYWELPHVRGHPLVFAIECSTRRLRFFSAPLGSRIISTDCGRRFGIKRMGGS